MRPIVHRSWPLVVAIVFAQLTQPVRAAAADDACAILTPALVGAAVGVAVGDGTYVTPTFKKTCTWTVGDSASGIRFVTLNLQGLDQFAAGKRVGGVKSVGVTPVGGIGDDAYYLGVGSTEGLIVKKGQRAFKIAVYSTLPLEKKRAMEKALAQQVLGKL
jgi:hypothetical protein